MGTEIADKMAYIVEALRKDPTRIRHVRGIIGYDADINMYTLRLAIDQVYALCRDLEKGKISEKS